jgi:hypothetical protein
VEAIVIAARIALPALLLVLGACASPAETQSIAASPGASPASVIPATPSPSQSPDRPPAATAEPSADPLGPREVAAIVEPIAIDGTRVLGLDAAQSAVVLDLLEGSVVTLPLGLEPNLRDLDGDIVVGMRESDNRKHPVALIYDVATGSMIDAGFGERRDSFAMRSDGGLVAGRADGAGLFVLNTLTGRMRTIDAFNDQDRVWVNGFSHDRLAGTYGPFDAEQAWLYDLGTDEATDLHGLLGGSPRNSWARAMDGDLVVGGVETPVTFVHRPWMFDAASGVMTDLGAGAPGSGDLVAIDGTLAVADITLADGLAHAFVLDLVDGTWRQLPDEVPPPGVAATGRASIAIDISGELVLGTSGWALPDGSRASHVVIWDLSAYTGDASRQGPGGSRA